MQMTDNQDCRNEPRKKDHVKFTGLKFQGMVEYIDEILNKLEKMLDQQIKAIQNFLVHLLLFLQTRILL